ncbi:MAG: caspase family protein [Fimbriimonadaceae bacterium]|nr:caspase family protein [Fimbriimonadaceae bacterium]
MKHLLPFVLLAAATVAAQADTAIVVGVNKYPLLGDNATLNGCVTDANNMAAKLKSLGFKVIQLTDGEATRAGILDAIKAAQGQGDHGRFVFYFAGHGSKDLSGRASVLLPNDAGMSSDANTVSAQELADNVRAVRASRGRTIISDSCHSGGLITVARAKSIGYYKPRYFERGNDGAKSLYVANDADKAVYISSNNEICYFTACKITETAGEKSLGGKVQGIFTSSLLSAMERNGNALWQPITTDTVAAVNKESDQTQAPQFSPAFLAYPVFGSYAKNDVNPNPQPKPLNNLEQLFGLNRPNPNVITIELTPNQMSFRRDRDGFHVKFEVKRAGYVALLEQDTTGNVTLWHPSSPARGFTQPSTLHFPQNPDDVFKGDTVGMERLKVLWFARQEDFEAVFKAFEKGGAKDPSGQAPRLTASREGLRKLNVVNNVPVANVHTAEISFSIIDP